MADSDADGAATAPPPSSLPPHPPPSVFFSERTEESSPLPIGGSEEEVPQGGSLLSIGGSEEEAPQLAVAQGSNEGDRNATAAGPESPATKVSDFDLRKFLRSSSAQAEDLARSVVQTTDSALQTARSQISNIGLASSEHIETAQSIVHTGAHHYRKYEDIFFDHIKEGIRIASNHPTVTGAVATAGALLLMRTPRRFLFRITLGRFRSEEAMLANAENKVKEMRQSVDLLKNETKKLEERAKLAEEEFQRGRSKLKSTGGQLAALVKNVYKTESGASGLMSNLRELPGREALKLRAEVASMAAEVKEQRLELNKTITKIASYGIPV